MPDGQTVLCASWLWEFHGVKAGVLNDIGLAGSAPSPRPRGEAWGGMMLTLMEKECCCFPVASHVWGNVATTCCNNAHNVRAGDL